MSLTKVIKVLIKILLSRVFDHGVAKHISSLHSFTLRF